ncbi:hypothetical protein [Campylobacter pinnipediorum]|uniref:hypothetical protein n=1 Tax=Campylobacter pinnipediorum TaxID=1965231 RepID=UPI001E5EA4B7|nr:hypothetical protein [Campylobacter pinnipediorum]
MIESADPLNPCYTKSIVWLSNPIEIVVVFTMVFVGMFAFLSLLQGCFIVNLRIWERLLLIPVVSLALVLNICAKCLIIPNEYISYIICAIIYGFVFLTQWIKSKKENILDCD